MTQLSYLDLDLPEVTEWLPEHDPSSPEENDAWIEREQALRYQRGKTGVARSPPASPSSCYKSGRIGQGAVETWIWHPVPDYGNMNCGIEWQPWEQKNRGLGGQ